MPPPAASIVVDADTGEVLSAHDARTPMLPASTTKIFTSLLVRQQLDLDQEIAISPDRHPGRAPPPRAPGRQPLGVEDLLYAALLCSCNDAAWALGQAAGGGTMVGLRGRRPRP